MAISPKEAEREALTYLARQSKLDAEYAEKTARARAQRKGWFVYREEGDDACAQRLNAISQAEGVIHEVWFLPERTFVILGWQVSASVRVRSQEGNR